MKPIIRMALRIPSVIPAAIRPPHETRSASILSASECSAMVLIGPGLGLLLLHEDLGEVVVLLEDRHDFVDQRLYVIVAGILALLLQRAHESFVIGASLLQKKPIKCPAACGRQF